jgi:N-acetylglucosaminyldiphosphoundecaprenol N-acetyl-beta-D-mannosaminyltransferase
VMEALHDVEFKMVLNSADLVVPDGMPLVWLGRLRGFRLARRVYGPELMLSVCERTAPSGVRHFFFGGAPDVPGKLAQALQNRFPGLNVAGAYSPPYRPVTLEEDEEIIAAINAAAPDVLWVGLSTPKQEKWMNAHRDRLRVPVLIGVGAAFDINLGMKRQAPVWMQERGLGMDISTHTGAPTPLEALHNLRITIYSLCHSRTAWFEKPGIKSSARQC